MIFWMINGFMWLPFLTTAMAQPTNCSSMVLARSYRKRRAPILPPFATQNFTIAGVFGFNGIIDDFRIYNEALSATAVDQLASGVAASVPEPSAVLLVGLGLAGLGFAKAPPQGLTFRT